jgi:hypothetical protein
MTLFICHVATRMTHVDLLCHKLSRSMRRLANRLARASLWSALVGRAPIVRCRRRSRALSQLLYPYQSTAKSPHDHVLSCTAHSTPSIVRMVYVISHFLAQYMQDCSSRVLLRAQTMVARRDSAQAGNRTSTCSWGWARSRPARSQAARHPKQRKPRQTSPVTNLVDHMRLK